MELTHSIAHLLTHLMEESPSWEAYQFSASQEIPHILCNPKVHYLIHKCSPSLLILSQLDPVHTPTSYWKHYQHKSFHVLHTNYSMQPSTVCCVYRSLTSGLLGSSSVETTPEVTVKLVQLTHKAPLTCVTEFGEDAAPKICRKVFLLSS
jgi:hypothetical protein